MTTVPVNLEMSAALMYGHPKVHCGVQKRNRWGWVAVTCRLHEGHAGPHVDVHAARRWA